MTYITTEDSRNKITQARYTVRVGDHEDTIYRDELRDGRAWDRFPEAVGANPRTVREALAAIVEDQARRCPRVSTAPAWKPTGELALPPLELLPKGYFERRLSDPMATDALKMYASANPKLALVMGLSWAAPYVAPLKRESCWVHMTGGSSEGKSTGLKAAASIWGRPGDDGDGVIIPWNVTGVGLGAALGDLGCLPMFLDELGASGFTPHKIMTTVFATTQGNERLRGDRGGRRSSSAPWRGILFSTGNETITSRIDNEAMVARVVEIPSLIVADAVSSEAVKALADAAYGHWGRFPIETMGAAVQRAEEALPLPPGGVIRRLARHLALGLAGAELYGGTPVYIAALAAAREVLEIAATELAERGVKPADRLLEAVRQALASRAANFPSRDGYESALRDDKNWRDVEGIYDGEAQTVAVLTSKLPGIAAAAGILDHMPGLRALARPQDGRLLTTEGNAKRGQHRRQMTIAARRMDVYMFRLNADEPPVTTGYQQPMPPAPAPVIPPQQTTLHDLHTDTSVTSVTSVTPGHSHDPQAAAPVSPPVPNVPAPRPAPVSRSAGPSLDDQLEPFIRAIKVRYPEVDETAAMQALRLFRNKFRGLDFDRSAGHTGTLLFSRINAQYREIPHLEPVRNLEVPTVGKGSQDGMRLANYFDYVDAGQAGELAESGRRWLMAYDINGQFLSAAGSGLELGTGRPARIGARAIGGNDPILKRPGYLQLAEPLTIAPGLTVKAGHWLAMPMVRYLHEIRVFPEAADLITWEPGNHRRWLDPWARAVRGVRDELTDRTDLPARYCLAAIKEIYAAFLGGRLRSEKWNTGASFRPDWNDHVVALSTANMWRALNRWDKDRAQVVSRTNPPALGTFRDTAWFALADNQNVEGLTISDQLGKWKPVRRAPVDAEIIKNVSAGSVYGVREALKRADQRFREGDE